MKFIIGLLVYMLVVSSNCFAWSNDPGVYKALHENPQNYIYYGYTGPGGTLYIDKSSINVHKYAPPSYIIAFNSVSYDRFPSGNYANSSLVRYAFDYNDRKMYIEATDVNGNKYWKYVETNGYSKLPANQMWLLTGGELAFYLAYNISFYNEPVSNALQNYLKTKHWDTFKE